MTPEMKAVREYILKHPHEFNMQQWTGNGCGTVGCIAGTACFLFEPVTHEKALRFREFDDIPSHAATLLGLEPAIARDLFEPNEWAHDLVVSGFFPENYEGLWSGNYRCDLTTVEAMKSWALRHVYEGGVVTTSQQNRIFPLIGPQEAVRCIDQLEETPHYVNWSKSIDPEYWESVA